MDINSFPMWIVWCLVIVGGVICFTVFAFLISRRYIHVDILKKHHELAGFIIGAFGVLYSVILGFTIVSSQDRYGQIVSKIDQEAYLAADLLRSTFVFPEKDRSEMHKGIAGYIKSVIEDEWPLMYQKKESPLTLLKLEKMWNVFYQFIPNTEREKLWLAKTLDILLDFNNARLKRIYSSWDSLGMLSWCALIIGGAILIILMFFVGTENIIANLILMILFTGYFSFMIFVVYSLDNPFRDPDKIKPNAYKIIYNYYEKARGNLISPEDSNGVPYPDVE